MKKLLLKYFIAVSAFFYCSLCGSSALAQVTFAAQTGGVVPQTTTIVSGTSQVCLMGFSATATSGSVTLNSFTFNASKNNIDQYIANATLYRSPTSTFSASSPGVVVAANVTLSGTTITISGFQETVSATNYYFLVADAVNTVNDGDEQIVVGYSNNFATDVNGNTYQALFSANYHHPYATGTQYPLAMLNKTTSLAPASTVITPGTTGLKLFEFAITNNSSSAYTLSALNINSTLSTLGSTLNNFKLYANTSDAFPTGSPIATLAATTSANVAFSSFSPSETIAAGSTKYYWLVADAYTGCTAGDVQFYFANGQSNPALTISSPTAGKTFNTFNIYGNTYSINYSVLNIASTTNGLTSTTLTAEQKDIAIFGFSLSGAPGITVSGFNINTNLTSVSSYFGNGRLYKNTTNTYSGATEIAGSDIAGTAVTFSGSFVTISGLSQSITSTPGYYFLVVDNTYAAATAGNTVTFKFVSGQSSAAVVSSGPTVSTYNTFSVAGSAYTIPGPQLKITGANSTTSNGITQGNLSYGQTSIVLFGFSAKALGSSFTLNQMKIKTSGSENLYFGNGRLYRSTSSTFPSGSTPLYTSTTSNGSTGVYSGGGGYFVCGVTETIPANTTYYYWLVVDYSVATSANTTFSCSFVSGQSSPAFITNSPYTTYNSYDVAGNVFNLVPSEKWVGTTDGDFSKASNFKALNGAGGTVPSGSMMVYIPSTTNSPVISNSTSFGGITFGTGANLTIASGQTVSLSNSITVPDNASVSIASQSGSSAGVISLANLATSSIGASASLNLNSFAKLSNAGTFSIASTGTLNLNGNSLVDNTGTFTLVSDASGSATIGALSGTSALTGSYNVQQYIRGQNSLTYRGYRLLSSPVSDATQTAYYGLSYLKGSGSYLTGTSGSSNGFDVSGNATVYLYRQDISASTNYRSVTKINNTNLYQITTADYTNPVSLPIGNGFLYFFRGNNSTNLTALPSDVTLTTVGHLNQGAVTVTSWFYPISSTSFQDANSLSYTPTSSVKGFNLVGNPYPSSINWTKAFDSSNGIVTTNISPTIYIYNPVTKTYATYNGSTGESKDGGSNVIASGQGFFVQATAAGAKLTFNETAKIKSQPGTYMLNSAPNLQTVKTLRLKLVKDSVQYEETLLSFNSKFNNNYVEGEDAPYMKGNGTIGLASQTVDGHMLAMNHLPFPKKSQSTAINVRAQAGSYSLNFAEQNNIPAAYDIWLKDAYMKDSLDIRQNSIYNFNVSADTNSAGGKRFSIALKLNPAKFVHLLSFGATKSTNEVKINWIAENEADYTTYVLERSTDGGKSFKILDSLTSAALGTYNDLDPMPILGDNYYRLKQVDVAGNISYSNTVKVMYANAMNTVLANAYISVYPNPAQTTLNMAVTSRAKDNAIAPGPYKITITNSIGLTVKTETLASANWQGEISNLLPGTYFIQVINTKDNSLTGKSSFVKL